MTRSLGLAAALAMAMPALAAADDVALRREARDTLPAVEAAARAAASNDPTLVQGLYDRARDLEEATRRASPATARCRPLARALAAYARGRVREAEGVDRLSSAARGAGQRQAVRARDRVATVAPGCAGRGDAPREATLPIEPPSGAATLGAVVARAPAGARDAVVRVDGRDRGRVRVRGGRARFALVEPPGSHDLVVRFRDEGGQTVEIVRSRQVIVLPASAAVVVPARGIDPRLSAAATSALAGGPRFAAAWVQDLATGSAGDANGGAAFPAASTVKLGLLAGSLARLGGTPEHSPLWPDVSAMVRWSSNLATNRLLARLGTGAAADGFRRLGARPSTFPGGYIVGTELQPKLPAAGASAPPPRVSSRVTTAQDLARMLFAIHATAVGDRRARNETGLSVRSARLALGLLLSSEQRGENRSIVAGGAPAGAPIAQKNGWIRSARHAAAIVYTDRGPWIAVLLTYDDAGVSTSRAAALGARLVRLARR